MEHIATSLVGAAVLIMALSAAATIWQLVAGLPAGRTRADWLVVLAFVVIFILGYLSYLVHFVDTHHEVADLIAPAMFFMGAAFVVLVSRVMLRTARDLSRVSVLETESITDALTGLHNRRDFDRRWEAELARARRFGLPLTLLIVDIDHFKHVNDTYGHAVGDQVLIAVSRLLCDCLRKSDVPVRYGGEEFAVIAPHTRPEAAVTLAERVRTTVERDACSALGTRSNDRGITVSIGIAGCDNATQGGEGIFEQADSALYAAKHEGRNRVVVSEPAAVAAG